MSRVPRETIRAYVDACVPVPGDERRRQAAWVALKEALHEVSAGRLEAMADNQLTDAESRTRFARHARELRMGAALADAYVPTFMHEELLRDVCAVATGLAERVGDLEEALTNDALREELAGELEAERAAS